MQSKMQNLSRWQPYTRSEWQAQWLARTHVQVPVQTQIQPQIQSQSQISSTTAPDYPEYNPPSGGTHEVQSQAQAQIPPQILTQTQVPSQLVSHSQISPQIPTQSHPQYYPQTYPLSPSTGEFNGISGESLSQSPEDGGWETMTKADFDADYRCVDIDCSYYGNIKFSTTTYLHSSGIERVVQTYCNRDHDQFRSIETHNVSLQSSTY